MELKLRQTVPLAILHVTEDSEVKGRTRMMKLVFLLEEKLSSKGKDLNKEVDMEFYPYDYGPFSKVLLDDLEELEKNGVIAISKSQSFRSERYDYRFTGPGQKAFNILLDNDRDVKEIADLAEETVDQFGNLSVRKLLDFVYDEYPEYRENSVFY